MPTFIALILQIFLQPQIEVVRQKIIAKSFLKKQLNEIYIGANINNIKSIIGIPNQTSNSEGFISNIYMNNYYILELINKIDERIVGYSVTIKDPDFNIQMNFFGNQINILETSFQEFRNLRKPYHPSKTFGTVLFHDLYYEEVYTGDYASSRYQDYAITLNDSGHINCYGEVIFHDLEKGYFYNNKENYKIFLESCNFNTISIFEPDSTFNEFGYYGHQFGMNQYENDLYEAKVEFN